MSLLDQPFLADIFALRPMSYFIRAGMAALAFAAAMKVESILGRVIGLAYLLIMGGALTLAGFSNNTIGDILLGIASLGSAGYTWWYTQV